MTRKKRRKHLAVKEEEAKKAQAFERLLKGRKERPPSTNGTRKRGSSS